MKSKSFAGRKEYFDEIAVDFDGMMNKYDLNKRLKIVFENLGNIKGKKVLDVGCGTGWFSAEAKKRGATVVAMDVGDKLLKEVKKKANVQTVVGDVTRLPFNENTFDVIICSEVIEHLQNKKVALKEMNRVLKPCGLLALSTPNKFWYPMLQLAQKMKLRKFEGMEHWVTYFQLKKIIESSGFVVKKSLGFHALPFIHKSLYSTINLLDRLGEKSPFSMVNMFFLAQKENAKKS